jgi:hypothetical protein
MWSEDCECSFNDIAESNVGKEVSDLVKRAKEIRRLMDVWTTAVFKRI